MQREGLSNISVHVQPAILSLWFFLFHFFSWRSSCSNFFMETLLFWDFYHSPFQLINKWPTLKFPPGKGQITFSANKCLFLHWLEETGEWIKTFLASVGEKLFAPSRGKLSFLWLHIAHNQPYFVKVIFTYLGEKQWCAIPITELDLKLYCIESKTKSYQSADIQYPPIPIPIQEFSVLAIRMQIAYMLGHLRAILWQIGAGSGGVLSGCQSLRVLPISLESLGSYRLLAGG